MGIDLSGRAVVVTGASSGIGRAVALGFAAAGCRLALTYFAHKAEAEEVVQRCLGFGADVFRVAAGDLEVEPGGDVDMRDYADS